jgi:hypothetical protein
MSSHLSAPPHSAHHVSHEEMRATTDTAQSGNTPPEIAYRQPGITRYWTAQYLRKLLRSAWATIQQATLTKPASPPTASLGPRRHVGAGDMFHQGSRQASTQETSVTDRTTKESGFPAIQGTPPQPHELRVQGSDRLRTGMDLQKCFQYNASVASMSTIVSSVSCVSRFHLVRPRGVATW